MRAIININGVDTPIDLPENMSGATAGGSTAYYTINYSRDVMEVGGTLTLPFSATKETYVEVTPPFRTLFTATATTLDIVGEYGEGAHIELLDNRKLRIYAHTTKPYTGDVKVMWSAKGVR